MSEDDEGIRCPFLGESVDAGTLICLADIEPVAVSRRYGDSYCLTPGHVNCSLYIAAVLADRSKAPPVIEPQIVTGQVPITMPAKEAPAAEGEPTETIPAAAEQVAHPEAVTPPEVTEVEAVPLTREQSIELAQDLSRLVEELSARVRQRRAANEALLRKMRTLQEMAENPAFLRRMLATGEKQPISAEDLDALQSSLKALIKNPHDLSGLVALAERSTVLEQAVNATLRIVRTLG